MSFSDNSSSHNYNARFQSFRNQAETQHLRFKSNNNESYNNPFSIEELTDAISKAHDTAVGPDDIHYQMLKHLPNEALQTLLVTSGPTAVSWALDIASVNSSIENGLL